MAPCLSPAFAAGRAEAGPSQRFPMELAESPLADGVMPLLSQRPVKNSSTLFVGMECDQRSSGGRCGSPPRSSTLSSAYRVWRRWDRSRVPHHGFIGPRRHASL